MIATKQSKSSPSSNKILEKSIKNTKAPPITKAQAATVDDHTSGSKNCTDQREDQGRLKTALAHNQHHHHQSTTNHHPSQNQPNETRSEIKQIEGSSQVATSTPAPNSPPSSPLATAPTMANARASLLTASTKIQQRQQKFLAAAAKSATSPQPYNYNHHHHHHHQQHNAWQTNAGKFKASPNGSGRQQDGSSGDVDAPTSSTECDSNTCCASVQPSCCQLTRQQHDQNAPILNQQLPSVRCCAVDQVPAYVASDNGAARTNQHPEGQKKSLISAPGPSKDGHMPNAHSKTKTIVAKVATCEVCDMAGDKASSEMSDHHHHHHNHHHQRQPQPQTQPQSSSQSLQQSTPPSQQQQQLERHSRVAVAGASDDDSCGTIDCASDAKIARVAAVCGASSDSAVTSINSADVCRVAGRAKCVDGIENSCEYRQHQLSHNHHHQPNHFHQHHHHQYSHRNQQPPPQPQPQPYNQSEVRRSNEHRADKLDEDDNINIKNNSIKHNHHYHYNNQHNYPHLQYQPEQQITTIQNQSNAAHPPQQVMAHYKFHNDCQSSVLTYEQVKRLDLVMDQVVPVHGRGNAPTLFVKLKELIRLVKHKLQHEHSIEIRDVRLNGGASNFVLAPENSHYNDLDLIFGTDLSDEDRFDVIRDVVLECLMEFYPKPDNSQQEQTKVDKEKLDQDLSNNCGHLSELSSVVESQQPTDKSAISVDSTDDDVQSEEASSRTNRSSSFESDNLNITSNELEEASDDDKSNSDEDDDEEEEEEEGNVIVRIDNDDDARASGSCGSQIGLGIMQSGPSTQLNVERASSVSQPVDHDNDARDASSSAEANKKINAIANQQTSGTLINSPSQQAVQYQYIQMPPNNCTIKEAYVHKMVKVNDDDRWSLISLGVQQSEANNYNHMQQQPQQQQQHHQDQHDQQAEANEALPMCCLRAQASSPQPSLKQHGDGFHQNQLPNSIELKFVDRMRRKFEFSVDSFQIILDSLIQFYDYAPQSTITIQRKLSSSHPSSTMVNTRAITTRRSSCDQCCGLRMMHQAALEGERSHSGGGSKGQALENFLEDGKNKKKHSKQLRSCDGDTCLNGSRSYYDLPLEQGNSSVASSSGCSSSSSVVSSSSSSLSCNEDHEDLDCDVDNSPSSSASTTSLLSSATVSVMSSNTEHICDQTDAARSQLDQIDDESNNDDDSAAQKSTTGKRTKKHTSRYDCTGKKCAVNECDYEVSKLSSCAVISENFYPTVIGRSEYGNFKEALYHLEKKLIATRSPEEIRGGGLLKYCNLLVKNYKPTNVLQIRTLERYMCSRFFIDFSDLNQQRAKLDSYLANHFSDDPMQKFHYLTILHNVVQRSTVCLMNHELRLTLNMIRELAYELNEQQHHHQGQCQLQSQAVQQRPVAHQQPLFSQPPHQQADQSVQQPQAQQYQQQNKPTVMQSGVYRVKLVNYALAKPIKS